jgi:hypothetical protein
VTLPGGATTARASERDGRLVITTPDSEFPATVVPHGDERHVFCRAETRKLSLVDPLAHAGEEEGARRTPEGADVGDGCRGSGEGRRQRRQRRAAHDSRSDEDGAHDRRAGGRRRRCRELRPGDRVKEGADLVDIDDA